MFLGKNLTLVHPGQVPLSLVVSMICQMIGRFAHPCVKKTLTVRTGTFTLAKIVASSVEHSNQLMIHHVYQDILDVLKVT